MEFEPVVQADCNWEPCSQQVVNVGNIRQKLNTPSTPHAAIIFTDVKASSKIWGQSSSQDWNNKVLSWIHMHFDLINELVNIFNEGEKHYGFIVKTVGDAAMIYCPWDLKKVILFSLCLQCHMRDLNDAIYRSCSKKVRNKIQELSKRIPKPKLISNEDEPPVFLSIRLGFCYGKFRTMHSPIQHCDFVDFFGPGVNLASRMESKICEIPGGIAFTVYSTDSSFEQSQREIRHAFKNEDLKEVIRKEFYKGYAIRTTTSFRELDIANKLHGALPVNKHFPGGVTNINIVILLPDRTNYVTSDNQVHSLVTAKGNLRNEYLDLLNSKSLRFEYLKKIKEQVDKFKKRRSRKNRRRHESIVD